MDVYDEDIWVQLFNSFYIYFVVYESYKFKKLIELYIQISYMPELIFSSNFPLLNIYLVLPKITLICCLFNGLKKLKINNLLTKKYITSTDIHWCL